MEISEKLLKTEIFLRNLEKSLLKIEIRYFSIEIDKKASGFENKKL